MLLINNYQCSNIFNKVHTPHYAPFHSQSLRYKINATFTILCLRLNSKLIINYLIVMILKLDSANMEMQTPLISQFTNSRQLSWLIACICSGCLSVSEYNHVFIRHSKLFLELHEITNWSSSHSHSSLA